LNETKKACEDWVIAQPHIEPSKAASRQVAPWRRKKVGVRNELHLEVDGDEPRRVAEFFEEMAMERDVPVGIVFKFQLALDELLTNVISYAFEDTSDATIKVTLEMSDERITAVIEDNGRPFNPVLDAPAPDLDHSAEDRRIGGLGIHLTKAFVDTLNYERADGWNRLSLVQPITAHPEENA
jgi:anti-sigma regulatory factor (Ser/Thr protein kinase)